MFRKIGGFVFIVLMMGMLSGTTAARAQLALPGISFCAPALGLSRLATANFVATGCERITFYVPAKESTLAAANGVATRTCGGLLSARGGGAAACAAAASGATLKVPGSPTRIGSRMDGGPPDGVFSVNAAAGHCAMAMVDESAITQPGSQTCGACFFKYAPYRMTLKGRIACGFVCQIQ
ncbi:MAG TPA: hypothetical protein VGF53_06560 [Pseudolabrys sp.]